MKKSMLLMTVIGLSIASNAAAMLIKIPKKSVSKMFQQRHFCMNKIAGRKKDLQLSRAFQLEDAVDGDDVKMADLLLKKFKIKTGNDWIKGAKSVDMIRIFEKYGCKIPKNYLHHAIKVDYLDRDESRSFIKNVPLIKYAIDRGVDPNTVNGSGENLWHILLSRPFYYQMDADFLLPCAKLLRSFGVDVHHKNQYGKSPIELVKNDIKNLEKRYEGAWGFRCEIEKQQEFIARELKVCDILLTIMNDEDFDKKEGNRE